MASVLADSDREEVMKKGQRIGREVERLLAGRRTVRVDVTLTGLSAENWQGLEARAKKLSLVPGELLALLIRLGYASLAADLDLRIEEQEAKGITVAEPSPKVRSKSDRIVG